MHRISRRGEERTASEIGGRRQPGSGNGEYAKGDVKGSEWLVERKDTSAKSYTLKKSDLEKHRLQALAQDREPVFLVAFVDGRQYAVIDWDRFLSLTGQE